MSSIKRKVPVMDFPVRVETDESPGWKWDTLTYDQIFAGKKVIVFGLPGAYTPTSQLTNYLATRLSMSNSKQKVLTKSFAVQ